MKKTLIKTTLWLCAAIVAASCVSANGKQANVQEIPYDEDCPVIYQARLIKPAHDYQKLDYDSYAVYGDLPIIKEIKESQFDPDYPPLTIWRTKEATYLAMVEKLGWVRTFYSFSDSTYLRDCDTGTEYPIIEVVNFPFNQDFFIEGVPGDQIYMLLKFPPLPKTTRRIDYYESVVGQSSLVKENPNLSIKALEANHHIITPTDRKIVY